MLEILASSRRAAGPTMCDRLSRRAMLRIGALAPLGLSLPALLATENQARAAVGNAASSFGKAKRCLLLFMWGGPAHQDLWDMKPLAPDNVRGEFKPVPTNVPGIQISELLPHIGKQMDKIALVRSVTHTDNNHSTSAHWMLTGHKHRLTAENFGASPSDMPHIGSVISKLLPTEASMPSFVGLPERIGTTAGFLTPGQFAGVLGNKYDPFTIDQHPDKPDFKVDMLAQREGLDPIRVAARKDLLATFNASVSGLDVSTRVRPMNAYYQKAADLVTSTRARDAFNLSAESDKERDRYGRGTFGQSVLLARRLLEAGVRLVTVYWHRDMPGVDTTWDTHGQNFKQLKERLVPQTDQPVATLLADLKDRGMLEDTLVVWSSEFGRTPKINGNAGRDHWGACNTIWFAGGGVPGGQVYGSSDKQAAFPADNPVGPADVTATIFHLLGIDPHAIIHDRENRPYTISHGHPLDTVLSNEARPKDDLLATAAPTSIKPNPEILADQPLAYWLMSETAGTVCRDLVGTSEQKKNGNAPGVFLGNLASGDQRMHVTLPGWSDTKYSVEFCFQNTRPHDADLVTGYLFSREGAAVGADADRGEHLGIGGTFTAAGDVKGKLILFNGVDTAEGLLAGKTVLEVGKFYHVVLTRDGDLVTIYLNGNNTPDLQGKLSRTFTTNHLFAATRSDGMFPMQGQIHSIAVFNALLSPERIAAHYQASGAKK